MIEVLVNSITKNRHTTDLEFYKKIDSSLLFEYILYGDNILEGIALINPFVDFLEQNSFKYKLRKVFYSPIDEPIYLFSNGRFYFSIKISGSYDRWNLPAKIENIKNFVDLPDYIIYSLKSRKAILAGENTDTASVGNSQWQREGRKIGAARQNTPFIYQTFYSGKDESQDTIREPSALQVYNQLVYSARYRTPSFVIYLSSNFKNADNHSNSVVGRDLISKYLLALIVEEFDDELSIIKQQVEKEIFAHMVDYITEDKNKYSLTAPRIVIDFPIINKEILHDMICNPNKLIDSLVSHCASNDDNQIIYLEKLLEFNFSMQSLWTSYKSKSYFCDLYHYIYSQHDSLYSYSRSSKIGWVLSSENIRSFLFSKGITQKEIIRLNPELEILLLPLRLHKYSNDKLTWSPDPESGEIVAFSELFSLDIKGNKIKSVLGVCIVDPGDHFDITQKGGKLYNALAEYVDLLLINNSYTLPILNKFVNKKSGFIPKKNIYNYTPKKNNEESAVVSVFLSGSTIKGDWNLNFIHTHHSSWQELMLYFSDSVKRYKNDRISTKLDLIMQNKPDELFNDIFLLAEGKYSYKDFFKSGEAAKIRKALKNSRHFIAEEKKLLQETSSYIDCFICYIENISSNEALFNDIEINNIKVILEAKEFEKITKNPYIVIGVYLEKRITKFKIFYSDENDEFLISSLDTLI